MCCSTLGLPVPQHLPEFAQVHVHCIGDAIQLSHPLMPFSPASLNLSQYQGLFQWVSCSLLIILSSLYSCWWEFLIINECWILSNIFLCIFCDDHVVLPFFLLLMWCITLIDLHMLNHPCDHGMSPTWSWFMILFKHYWIWFANILLRIFASIFMKDIDL